MSGAAGVAALGLLLSACGGGAASDAGSADGAAPDATVADGAPLDAVTTDAAPVDAATGLQITWAITEDEAPATCAEVGAVLVRVSWGAAPDVPPFRTYPCAAGTALVDAPDAFHGWVSAVDAAGTNFANVGVALRAGATAATVLLEVFTEPAPQLAAIAAVPRAVSARRARRCGPRPLGPPWGSP